MPKKLTEKDFNRELDDLIVELRRNIEAWQSGLDPSDEARAVRRKRVLLDGDFEFFAYTYFPHHIRGEPSRFQRHFCHRYPRLLRQSGGLREWWIAPRGEAKSSLANKIGPVWVAIQGLLQQAAIRDEIGMKGDPPPFMDYVVLLGAETRQPTKLLEVVKGELTINPSLSMDFPEACGRGPVWKVGECVTKTGVKVEPFGAEQAIRGTFHGASRPKLLSGDDLITDAEAKSPTERENRWNWLERAIDYLGPPDGSVKYVGVGTVLNRDDPISRARNTVGHVVHHFKAIERLPDRLDLWQRCEELMRTEDRDVVAQFNLKGQVAPDDALPSHRFYKRNRKVMEKGAEISWPSVRSLYWLMRQRAKNLRAFGTEMQGEGKADEDQVFTVWQYWVQRGVNWIYYGACDPSMGKDEKSDPSAILGGAWDPEKGTLNVIEADIRRRVPSRLMRDLTNFQKRNQCVAIAFENNNAYEFMRQKFIESARKLGTTLPLVGITASIPAEVRIDSIEPFITDRLVPKILFSASLSALLDELRDWPDPQPHHHFDGLTALHLLWHIASTRAGKFAYHGIKGTRR